MGYFHNLALVVDFAKKTGDYAVLSHADLCVLALTCTVAEEAIFRLEMESMAQVSACFVAWRPLLLISAQTKDSGYQ